MLDYPLLTTLRVPSGCPRWSGGCPAGALHPDFVRKPQNQGRKPVLATISTHAAKEMARRIQISGAELGSEGIGTRIDIHIKSSQAFSYGLGLLLEDMRRCSRRCPHLHGTAVNYFNRAARFIQSLQIVACFIHVFIHAFPCYCLHGVIAHADEEMSISAGIRLDGILELW